MIVYQNTFTESAYLKVLNADYVLTNHNGFQESRDLLCTVQEVNLEDILGSMRIIAKLVTVLSTDKIFLRDRIAAREGAKH